MKKFFGLFLFLGLVCFSYDVSAQGAFVSSKGKPIMKGDSVFVMLMWDNLQNGVEFAKFEGFYSPDSIDLQNKKFAMYMYPKATRKFVFSRKINGKMEKETYPRFLEWLTIVVLDENGNEVRDEYSDVPNTPVDYRKLDVAGKTPNEMLQAYNLTHKEIPAKKETVENSATEQKSQNEK
ncbi:MAG: hypothetical protein J6R62_03080 [Rikenellaceae bacterium]|nr:hypothetical protein [Rikenellaceae bacterium]